MTFIILLIAVLSFGFGYFFGYTTKTRQIDREIEDMDGEMPEDLHENCADKNWLNSKFGNIYKAIREINTQPIQITGKEMTAKEIADINEDDFSNP